MRASGRLIQLVPEPALSKVSGPFARQMAGRKGIRTVAGELLPRRIYFASTDRRSGTPECARDLPHPVPRGVGNAAYYRGRPQTPGGFDRVPRRASHLGPESSSPSASSLRCAGWRHRTRRGTLGRLPEVILSSGPSAEPALPEQVSDLSEEGVSAGQAAIPRRDGRPGQTGGVRSPLPRGGTDRMGRLRQATIRRSRASPEISGPLHTSGCNLK